MKKKLNLLLIIVAILAASIVTLAPTPPPPPDPTPTTPPPSEPATCSPGFWKNHTGIWESWAGDDFVEMLAGLQGGKDTRISRFVIAGILNAEFPDAPCDD